jgi:hypothetical protein
MADLDDPHAPAGPLPTVHDEAADTPAWLPVVGLVLFTLMLLWMLYRATQPEPALEPAADEAAEAAEAPPPGE